MIPGIPKQHIWGVQINTTGRHWQGNEVCLRVNANGITLCNLCTVWWTIISVAQIRKMLINDLSLAEELIPYRDTSKFIFQSLWEVNIQQILVQGYNRSSVHTKGNDNVIYRRQTLLAMLESSILRKWNWKVKSKETTETGTETNCNMRVKSN